MRPLCGVRKPQTADYTGLRLGELLGLDSEGVDFDKARIHVRQQWARDGVVAKPKTPAANRVATGDEAWQVVGTHGWATAENGARPAELPKPHFSIVRFPPVPADQPSLGPYKQEVGGSIPSPPMA
jgi:hypothetical protein